VLRPIQLFVASPGGVENERAAVREVADELNVPLRRHGWEVIVLGWEERGPASGRAQADINADVRVCDVFVGVVWTRWGTPTGEYSSGFAEEWAIARERYERSGLPGLWLYFKEGDAAGQPDPEQVAQVAAFRREVEQDEIAFYKTFGDTPGFTSLLRPRLLDEVLRRSGLTRTDIGGVAVDWSSSYGREPVVLVPGGLDRKTLADELAGPRPAEAARLYTQLADDLEGNGLTDEANDLRIVACRALLGAGTSEAAIALLRRVLGDYVWWLRLEEIQYVLNGLGDALPPEFASERQAWIACAEAAGDAAATVERLGEALGHQHAFALDATALAQWRALRWRCLLDLGDAARVVDEAGTPSNAVSDLDLELSMLRADALRTHEPAAADAAWLDLRLQASTAATEQPERAAWISTRLAYDLVAQEELGQAEAAYADAASRWAATSGGQEQAAQAFFSAQAATRLHDPWSFRGWSWRGVAAAQRSSAMSFARRAEQLEIRATAHRLDGEHDQAAPLLVVARWCHQRAGLLHGVLRDMSLLADLERDRADYAEAAELHCRSANVIAAEKITDAADSSGRRAIADRLGGGEWPTWAVAARCAALARVGRSATPEVANTVVPFVINALQGTGKRFDNTPDRAAAALAQLVLAIDDAGVRANAVQALAALAANDRYQAAEAGRTGLRMLSDMGDRGSDELLIAQFVADDGPNEPDPRWVANRLDEGAPDHEVVQAALHGHTRALLALLHADRVSDDVRLREVCARRTVAMLNSDLGMTPDGQGMHGLMALNTVGMIADGTDDLTLIRATAERLLMYALETRWPINNRASAVSGLWMLRARLDSAGMLRELRPLAIPDGDLDDDAGLAGQALFAERGQLEATALHLCASIASSRESVSWLDEAITEAMLDEREPLREAGWRAAAIDNTWFDDGGARHAMLDPSAHVRAAAVYAWRRRAQRPLSASSMRHLLDNAHNLVQFELVELLAERPDQEAAAELMADADAYVRGVARARLSAGSAPPPP
jgi:hypothetical protein